MFGELGMRELGRGEGLEREEAGVEGRGIGVVKSALRECGWEADGQTWIHCD